MVGVEWRRRLWIVVTCLLAGWSLTAQAVRRSVPREDTVTIRAGHWIQLDGQMRYIGTDTSIVLGPESSFEVINNLRSQCFYDSLEAKSRRNRLMAQLHHLLIRRPSGTTPTDGAPVEQIHTAFLPFEGLVISRIIFQQVDLFHGSVDDTTKVARSWTGKTLNTLHIDTRGRVLRRFVLFGEGEALHPDKLADTERLLRSLSYIEDARIYVVPDSLDPKQVEVRIVTKDRFSLGAVATLRGLGKFRGGIYDDNLFGLGLEMGHQLLFNDNYLQPFGYGGWLHVDNLGRHLVTADLQYQYTSQVNRLALTFDRGFFTPGLKYVGGFELARTSRFRPQLAAEGAELYLPYSARLYDVWAGRFFELPGRSPMRNSLSVAMRYAGLNFENRPAVDANENFFFHRRSLFLTNFTFTSRQFFRSRNFTGFGDTEDIPLGFSAALTGGYDFGEFHRRPYAGAELSAGGWIDKLGYFGLEAVASAFLRDGNWEDGLLRLRSLYFTPLQRLNDFRLRHLAELRYVQGICRVTPTDQIDLRHVLRNYPNDLTAGQSSLSLKLESILFTPWNAYGFKTALFAFSDLTYLAQRRPLITGKRFFAGFGIGARLRNRSLVLPTMEFRLVYLPKVIGDPQKWFADYSSSDPRLFLNLNPSRPRLPGLE